MLAKRGVFIPAVISIRSLFEGVWTPLTGGKRLVGGVSMDKREPLRYVAELLADDALRVVIDTTSPMDRILRAMGLQVERGGGVWSFEYLETPVLIITDSKANRMRVMSPVIRAEEVTADQWAAILVANFHTALDARYAVSSGTVYSLFLHPLGSLTDAELRSAIGQVVVLSTTFGSTYTSSGIAFGGGTPPNSEPATKPTPSL